MKRMTLSTRLGGAKELPLLGGPTLQPGRSHAFVSNSCRGRRRSFSTSMFAVVGIGRSPTLASSLLQSAAGGIAAVLPRFGEGTQAIVHEFLETLQGPADYSHWSGRQITPGSATAGTWQFCGAPADVIAGVEACIRTTNSLFQPASHDVSNQSCSLPQSRPGSNARLPAREVAVQGLPVPGDQA